MDEKAKARLQRLVRWLKTHRREAIKEDGKVSPSWMANHTTGNVGYWSDVLREKKSFAAEKARDTEDSFEMPPLYLEGAGWPFETIDQERFDRLSERQKGRVEQAVADALALIESESEKQRGVGT